MVGVRIKHVNKQWPMVTSSSFATLYYLWLHVPWYPENYIVSMVYAPMHSFYNSSYPEETLYIRQYINVGIILYDQVKKQMEKLASKLAIYFTYLASEYGRECLYAMYMYLCFAGQICAYCKAYCPRSRTANATMPD